MSKTILEHAAYELSKAGLTTNEDAEARQVAINTMALIRRIEKQKNNEKQQQYVVESFYRLCQHLPLSPITDDPAEWEKFEIDRKNIETGEIEKKVVWQSRRVPSLFSEDEGKTFIDQKNGQTGTSQHDLTEAEKKELDEKVANSVKPETESEVPAEEVPVTGTATEAASKQETK